jgi:hypothetical protein
MNVFMAADETMGGSRKSSEACTATRRHAGSLHMIWRVVDI